MKKIKFDKKIGVVRKLNQHESIPYPLLLLADETKEAINVYIKDSEIYILEKETKINEKNKIIGIYVLQSVDKDTIEIKNIAVDEKFQGQGIGTFLLKDAEIQAKKKGFKTIIIGTGDCGRKQLYLYQKMGFEIFDVKKNFLIDNYPEPIYENGVLCKDMVMLQKKL